jgi:hypothetical protein
MITARNFKGTFYAKELQQVVKTDDVYEVEEVLAYKKQQRVGKKIIPEVKVRWKGFPPIFDSWISQADLILPTASNGNSLEKNSP